MSATRAGPDDHAAARRFLRFCCVGAAGFVTDTGILLALVRVAGIDPRAAKALSFAVAVLVTFDLNRRWAFGTIRTARPLTAFGTYLTVQGIGFLCNWAVFTLCLMLLPVPFGGVLVSAVVASAAALLFNYVGAARFVFADRTLR